MTVRIQSDLDRFGSSLTNPSLTKVMKAFQTSCLAVLTWLAVVLAPATLRAGTLFVSGDSNIGNYLTGSTFGTVAAGNQTFFQNLLQDGSAVRVLESTSGASSANMADLDISTFYNTISGVSSTLVSGTISSETLLGVDLFVSLLPDDPFSTSEVTVLRDFLSTGGSIFFLGENSYSLFTDSNDIINSVLTDLGSGMAIVPDAFDSYAEALGSQIAADPFTTGVGSFHYSVASEVSGGIPLIFGSGQQPFVAYRIVVPEPSALLIFLIGLLILGSNCRWRCPMFGTS